MIEWNRLRAIGNSPAAKSAIIVPVLGYFVLFNDEIVRWLRLHAGICGEQGCDVTWRLAFLYFGGCAFAVGAIIYGALCPPQIRKYGDATEYIAGEQEVLFAHPLGGKKDRLDMAREDELQSLHLYSEATQPFIDNLVETARTNKLERPIPQVKEEHRKQVIVDSLISYDQMNHRRSRTRWIVASLYVAGSLLVAAPTVWTFCEVVLYLIQRKW